MDKILKLILSCAFVIGLSAHGPIADAQRGTAFDARFKIAEGADLRILDETSGTTARTRFLRNGRRSERIRVISKEHPCSRD